MLEKPFNILTCSLQTEITVNGKTMQLFTSTARAVDCLEILENKELTEREKKRYILSRMVALQSGLTDAEKEEAYKLVLRYLSGPNTPEYEKINLPSSGEKLIYWALDSQAITASFRHAYGLSLKDLQQLHFWEFLALLYNIPSDTRMGSLMATRNRTIDTSLPAKTQLEQAEIKKGARPKDTRPRQERQKEAVNKLVSALM